MAEGDQPPMPKRIRIAREDVERMSREELVQKWFEQDAFVDGFIARNPDLAAVADLEEKLRQLQQESSRRENVLVMRLTAKEQELQEFVSQNDELKRAQNPSTAQLRSMLLDPAINLMFQRMKKEMEQSKEKLEQAQNDLAAWKFTPDGQTGKRLMAKCRMLLQENEELGQLISAGRTAKLEGEIALGKKFVEEMKQSQAETDEFLVEMDEDVEGLQSTIYLLQQQLREAKEQINELQQNDPNRTNGQASNRNSSNPPKIKEERLDSLAGEQRTSQYTGNNESSNSNVMSGSGSRDHSTEEHKHAPTHSQTTSATTNGSSHHMDTDTDSSQHAAAAEKWTGMQNHDDQRSRHSDDSSGEPMETDSGVGGSDPAPRTASKVKVEALQNGMVEAQSTA